MHPYERKLIEISNSYDLPPPPPEFLRLIRDRAELKAKCLLFQADQNKQLHLLSTDQERVTRTQFRPGTVLMAWTRIQFRGFLMIGI